MRYVSLRSKLLMWIMPIAILGLVSLSLVAYKYINIVIEKELSSSMLVSIGKSAESINRWLTTIMIEPETIASTPAAKNINEDFQSFDLENINRYKMLHSKYPDIFQDIYAANRKGEYHTVQQKGSGYSLFIGNIEDRPYFRSIMAGGPTQITPPLISRTTGIPTIFMVSPIVDDQERPQGLVGAGISLKYIQQIAQGLRAGKTGYGFIIAKDGTFISHPNSRFVMHKKITEFDDISEKKLGELMLSGRSGMYRFTRNGKGMVAFYQPIPITGWSVATVLPASELFAPANRMIRLLTIITVIFVVLIGTAILIAMQRLIRPLQILALRTQEIAQGNLDGATLSIMSNDEIGVLSQSFNTMIDNLKKTLSGLKKSEDNYRGIFQNSIEGIVQTTVQGQVVNANPAMAKMLGFMSPEKMIAFYHDIGQQLFVNPDDRKRLLAQLFETGAVHDLEVQYRRHDAEFIWVSISAFLVRDTDGTPLRIDGLVSNIDDKKKAAQEREKLFEQLMQAQKLEAVGQLAGGIAHDFNNMLAVILGRSQLALLQMQPEDTYYKPFVEIQSAAEHSANLTRQLLGFARKQTVAPKVIDINQTIHGILKLLRRLIPEDIDLVFLPAEEIWMVLFDPDQIGQILTNLCVNARDAMQGVGRIVIETQKSEFDSAYCANYRDYLPGEYTCLSVCDTGSGMDKATQEHIFEPFFTTKEKSKGTGLGLSTVYGIVKQNNSFINIYSEPGQGSTFKIYIPRYIGKIESSSVLQSFGSIPRSMGMVLLVEDEQKLLDLSTEILEELGCRVLAANSTTEAIKYAEDDSLPIDLLITDVVMPEMNGRELSSSIMKIRPSIRCLFMSGYTANIIAHKGVLDMGVNFIQKPFSLQAMAAKIREVMNQNPSELTN